jgi:hypothetical protein
MSMWMYITNISGPGVTYIWTIFLMLGIELSPPKHICIYYCFWLGKVSGNLIYVYLLIIINSNHFNVRSQTMSFI